MQRPVSEIVEELIAAIAHDIRGELREVTDNAFERIKARQVTFGRVGALKARPAKAPGRPAKPEKGPTGRPKFKVRDKAEVERLVQGTFDFIQKNPNTKSGPIAEALGVPRLDLVLPLKKLKAKGQIVVKGIKANATYRAK